MQISTQLTSATRRRRGLLGAAMGAALLLAACGSSGGGGSSSSSSSSSQNTEPFRVLSILSETGPVGVLGTGDHQAIAYAADQINAKGGILGRKVVIDFVDDQGDAVRGTSLLTRALSQQKYDLIDAGSISQVNLALRKSIAQSGTLALSVAGGINIVPADNPTFFTVSPPQTAAPDATMEYILNDLKVKKVALLTTNDAAGQATSAAYQKGLPAGGAQIVANVQVAPTAVDVTSQLQQVRSSNPDVVLVSAFGAIAGHIAQGVTQLGMTNKMVGDLLISASNLPSLVPQNTLTNWSYIYNSLFIRPVGAQPNKGLSDFYNALTTKYGSLKASINQYTSSWDLMWLAKWAAETTKSTDGKTMAQALENFSSKVSSSNKPPLLTFTTYAFSATNHSPIDPAHITDAVNPFFAVGAASTQVIAGTVEKVSDIHTQPNNVGI
jgi:branched-chain amino acid transport system substrate-binding protein